MRYLLIFAVLVVLCGCEQTRVTQCKDAKTQDGLLKCSYAKCPEQLVYNSLYRGDSVLGSEQACKETGDRRMNESGNRAAVWKAIRQGSAKQEDLFKRAA